MKIDADDLLQWLKDQTLFAENERKYYDKLVKKLREELSLEHNTVLREEGRISLYSALEKLSAAEAELKMLQQMQHRVAYQIEQEGGTNG